MSGTDLAARRCQPCTGLTPAVTGEELEALLARIPGWSVVDGALERIFAFKNYYQTTAFVNAVAWIAHREDHHPSIEFGYKTCKVRYHTHAIGGLSINDFICAAKIDALVES